MVYNYKNRLQIAFQTTSALFSSSAFSYISNASGDLPPPSFVPNSCPGIKRDARTLCTIYDMVPGSTSRD